MFLRRVFGSTLFAAAKSEAGAGAEAAATLSAARNPLEQFFEAERNADDEKPFYGKFVNCLNSPFSISFLSLPRMNPHRDRYDSIPYIMGLSASLQILRLV